MENYPQHFKNIRAAIKKAVVDNSDTIKQVEDHDVEIFSGMPALIISPSDNEADYGTTTNDKVLFSFKLRAYYPTKDDADYAKAETALEKVVDELLAIFRERGTLGTACDWVAPVPSVWFYEQRGAGIYRGAEITLKCIKYVS